MQEMQLSRSVVGGSKPVTGNLPKGEESGLVKKMEEKWTDYKGTDPGRERGKSIAYLMGGGCIRRKSPYYG